MFKKLVSSLIVLGLCIGTLGTVPGCSSGSKDMSNDKTPPPAEKPATEQPDELPDAPGPSS